MGICCLIIVMVVVVIVCVEVGYFGIFFDVLWMILCNFFEMILGMLC